MGPGESERRHGVTKTEASPVRQLRPLLSQNTEHSSSG